MTHGLHFFESTSEPKLRPKTVRRSKRTSNLVQKSRETKLFRLRYALFWCHKAIHFLIPACSFGTRRHRSFQILCEFYLKFPSSGIFCHAMPIAHALGVKMFSIAKSWSSGLQNLESTKFVTYFVSPPVSANFRMALIRQILDTISKI